MSVAEEKRVIAEYYVASCLLLILLYMAWRIWKYIKLYAEFPTFPLIPYLAYSTVMNKIPKHLPFSAFFFQKLILLAQRFHEEGLYLCWIPKPTIAVFGEEALKALINDQDFLEKPDAMNFSKEFLGNGLLTSDVDTWRKHRKLLNPVFHVGMLKHKMQIFNDSADNMVKKLEKEAMNETPIVALDLIKICTFGVLCEYVFGLDRSVTEDKEIMELYLTKVKAAMKLIIMVLGQPWLRFKFLRKCFASTRKHEKLIDDRHNFCMEIILKMKDQILLQKEDGAIGDTDWKDDKETRKSFAHILLDHHLKDKSFTMENVKDQVSNFIGAGYDTVSHTVLFSLFLLGHDPDVQNRAYDEVKTLSEEPIKYEDLQNLVYLDCVIKETIRLYPMGAMIGRKLHKDKQCGKYNVSKGTDIVIFPYVLHRNPRVYPDPEKFYPERFQEVDSSIRSENYIPFGIGIRNCIGKGFAMIEIKVILAYILRNFRITSLDRKEDVDVDWNITLAPVRPLHFSFKPRK